ncbi:MAG TPA: MFS transporter [Acidimicrobiales bacterium]|jgi:DHA2 family methylenomycin A resistance protein-like MFS transporter|nr:MFS transporter [Acidimicrobiales bacterium]
MPHSPGGTPDAGDPDEEGLRSSLSLLAVCTGFFLIQLDATVVNVALPSIAQGLGASLSRLQWVVDAYTLALAGLMLTFGSVADRLGARRVFSLGVAVFTIGSLACALAPNQDLLVDARVVQGLGAAALLPCSLALLVHQFPDHRRRARAIGVWGAAGSVGVAAGPVLGGALIASVGWREIFLINVPVGVIEVWLLRRFVTEAPRRAPERVDGRGLGLSVVSLVLVTAACIEAGSAGWTAPLPLVLFVVGLAAGAAFWRAERANAAPMLPPELFRSRPFSAAVAVGACFNFALYGALLCLSIYLQQTRGESALRTGLLLLPMAVLVAAGSVVSGRLIAGRGHRAPMMLGLLIACGGAAALAAVNATTSLSVVVGATLALGLCSVAMPALSSLAVGSAPAERAGLASGVLHTARQAGGALGVAVLGSMLALSGRGPPHYTLAVPLGLAAAVLAAGAGMAWVGTRDEDSPRRAKSGPAAGTTSGGDARRLAPRQAVAQRR